MSKLRLDPPPNFSFEPKDWKIWNAHFERYRKATGLASEPDEDQINALLYIMGLESETIFNSFTFQKAEEKKKYALVVEKFGEHFLPKQNVIHERFMFYSRNQRTEEPAEKFITDLHKLAETCEFDKMKDEMIRDKIVIGVFDSDISKRLQSDRNLTLDKAIEIVRMAETINEQHEIQRSLVSPTESSVHRVSRKFCSRCGGSCRGRISCPARNATCHNCSRKGHFAQQCNQKSKKIYRVAPEYSDDDFSDEIDFCVG